MHNTTVICTREHKLAQSELLDSPEPLKLLGVDQPKEKAITAVVLKRNKVVDRIPNDLGPCTTHADTFTGAIFL
jgi:hypothetical protein